MSNLLALVIFVAVIIFLVTVGPWCFIWAINTLVAAGGVATFHIPFTVWTWLAALVLGGLAVIPAARRK